MKKSGRAFACEKCGECCRADGYVYLKKGDARAAADYLGMKSRDFLKDFTFKEGRFKVFEKIAGQCVFLIENRCIIYPARPEQCRDFPFWKIRPGKNCASGEVFPYCVALGHFPGSVAADRTKERGRK